MDLGTLRFSRNGRDLGVAVQGLEGTLFPAFSMYNRYASVRKLRSTTITFGFLVSSWELWVGGLTLNLMLLVVVGRKQKNKTCTSYAWGGPKVVAVRQKMSVSRETEDDDNHFDMFRAHNLALLTDLNRRSYILTQAGRMCARGSAF